jgi:hypothetical protein
MTSARAPGSCAERAAIHAPTGTGVDRNGEHRCGADDHAGSRGRAEIGCTERDDRRRRSGADADRQQTDRAHREEDQGDVGGCGRQAEARQDDPGAEQRNRGEAGDDQRDPVPQARRREHPQPGGEAPMAEAMMHEPQPSERRDRPDQHQPRRPVRDRADRRGGQGRQQRGGADLKGEDRGVREGDLGDARPRSPLRRLISATRAAIAAPSGGVHSAT